MLLIGGAGSAAVLDLGRADRAVGDWRTQSALVRPADAVLAEFDPFFRLHAGERPTVVTSLTSPCSHARGPGNRAWLGDHRASGWAASQLHGRREIMPGRALTAVGFDNVTIDRQGTASRSSSISRQRPPWRELQPPARLADGAAGPAADGCRDFTAPRRSQWAGDRLRAAPWRAVRNHGIMVSPEATVAMPSARRGSRRLLNRRGKRSARHLDGAGPRPDRAGGQGNVN